MPHTLPILYSFRRCPYAIRARLAIWQSGVSVELREVVLRDKPPQLLAASGKASVPVLIMPNGDVIEQSVDIMHWALAQSDAAAWLNVDLAEQQALVARHDEAFKPLLDAYKYSERHPELTAEQHQQAAMYWLAEHITKRLGQHTYLIDQSPRFADMAIAPFIRQFAAVDSAWFAATAPSVLQNWLSKIVDSAEFNAVMGKYPQWHAGDAPLYFGRER